MNSVVEFLRNMKQRLTDWIVVLVLAVLFVTLEVSVPPYVRYITPNQVDSLKYPEKSNSVPVWAVPLIGTVLPLLVFTAYLLFWKCEMREYHDLILGIFMNIMLTACLTSALKESIGRPRPDFYKRCFPDGIQILDAQGYWKCHPTNESAVREGRKSFPSGHSSWSMSSLAYLSFFLMGKMQVFSGIAHLWKLIISWLPIFLAVAVGVTRINDYWHHWTDVVTGLTLGFIIALIVYVQFYKNPFTRAGTQIPIYQFFAEVGRSGLTSAPSLVAPYMSLESGPASGCHETKNVPEPSEGEPFLAP